MHTQSSAADSGGRPLGDQLGNISYEFGRIAGALRAISDIINGNGSLAQSKSQFEGLNHEDLNDLFYVLAATVQRNTDALYEIEDYVSTLLRGGAPC